MSGEISAWIADTMVSMTLLMVLVLLIRKPVAHFFGANISYLLWTLPLARLFMPTLTLEAPAAVEAVEPAGASFVASSFNAMASTEQSAMAASAFASIDWLSIAIIIWIGGAGILFISKLASYFQFREDIVSDGQLVGRHGNIKILETAAVGGPLAFGLFQRYIAVPTNFFQSYAPRERELALDHEIAHHESGDLVANFAGLLILSLHWFNPVAWLAWIAFRQDQETACDARILQKSGRKVRAVYGRTIAKSASGHRLGLASPLGQKNKIKDRLKMLGQSEKSKLRKRLGALMVGVGAVIALPLTATVTYAEVEAEEARPHEGTQITSDGLTVDVGRNGVVVAEKLATGYKYTVKNKRGSFEFPSDRRLSDKQIAKRVRQMKASFPRPMAPPAPPAPPVAPTVFDVSDISVWTDKDKDGAPLNITITNENSRHDTDRTHARTVKINGRTVVIVHTDNPLGEREARELAEEARREAAEDRREHKLERDERRRESSQERHEAARERKEAEREWQREMKEVEREVEREARKVTQKARKTGRQTSSVWSIANQISEISFAPRAPRTPRPPRVTQPSEATLFAIRNVSCKAISKDIPYHNAPGVLTERAWAAAVKCSGYEPNRHRKKLLQMTLRVLQDNRSTAASCQEDDAFHTKKMLVYDREIKHLKRKITTA